MSTKNLVRRLDKINGKDESLGKAIQTIRLCDEVTQKDFADILGVTVSYLSDLENNRKIVSAKKAYEYAEKLGYSTKEFVRLALQDEANKFMEEKGFHANVMLDFEKIVFA
jgi:transcriptional regulator with XRE-family HTH domain